MYKATEFKAYFTEKIGAAPSTANTYISYLNRIDRALDGLDESIATRGSDEIWRWGVSATEAPFDTYPSHARSVLKRYLTFLIDRATPSEDVDEIAAQDEVEEKEISSSFFKIEKEMQAAVRKQLEQIEAGLKVIDDGNEYSTATGRIDILAKDNKNCFVAIELKAGNCPPGALEQVLGYAQALSEEKNEPVRAILIAANFSDRIRAAARRCNDVRLLDYKYLLQFSEQH